MRFYIDPGTGSMLFAILIGIIGAVTYMLKSWILKLRFVLSGGKKVDTGAKKIPLVIFSDDKRYWSVFRPVCRELDKKGIDTVYMTASPDDPALENDLPHIHAQFIEEGNKAFAKLNFLNASVEQVRALEKLRALPAKEIVKVGIPYMDDMLARLHADPPLPEHERTVLLAPSWGESAILKKYGGRIIDTLLATGYHIIIRPHPQSFRSEQDMMAKLMRAYPDSPQLEWNRDADNYDVLRRSDILISDFSGVIFDFSLVYDKPVIYTDTDFDDAPYDAWWLDTPYWTFDVLPRIGQKLTEENMPRLRELIDACLRDPRYQAGSDEARAQTWEHIGQGARNTADYLERKLTELSAKTASDTEIGEQ